MPHLQRAQRSKRPSRIYIALACVLALAAGTLIVLGMIGAGSEPEYVKAPSIEKPFAADAADTFTGPTEQAADQVLKPMTLSIPAVELIVALESVGVNEQGVMQLPESSKAGWYTNAAPIGSAQGSTVIAGHVNYPDARPAPMAKLAKIVKGTPIFLTDKDGKTHRYKAVEASLYGKHALPESFFTTAGPPQLVLVTCGGDIGTLDGVINYLDNAVVRAIPWP